MLRINRERKEKKRTSRFEGEFGWISFKTSKAKAAACGEYRQRKERKEIR